MDRISLKSKSDKSETILPVRCTLKFSRVCRAQSNVVYPDPNDARESAARFIRNATMEKLASLKIDGKYKFDRSFLKSLL